MEIYTLNDFASDLHESIGASVGLNICVSKKGYETGKGHTFNRVYSSGVLRFEDWGYDEHKEINPKEYLHHAIKDISEKLKNSGAQILFIKELPETANNQTASRKVIVRR